jgi:glutamate 5-kinase
MSDRRIVIKIGTSTLTSGSIHLDHTRMADLVRQMVVLTEAGEHLVLVSSGAIAAGREILNFPQLPADIPAKQMLAAVGQPGLMNRYESLFAAHHLRIAQLLLTREDISNRKRYLNARNTLELLLAHSILPIINENDSVAVEEIRIGDNDNLSALVANLVEADLLILLTDQSGLYTSDPRQSVNASLIDEIRSMHIPPEAWQAAGGSPDGLGTGGMVTKLQAAEVARRSGTAVVIALGCEQDILLRLAAGEKLGTRISATTDKLESRKRFLLASAVRTGSITIDAGALQAIRRGGSLLPAGVRGVQGRFEQGDCVYLLLPEGDRCALGLVNYSAREVDAIRGCRTAEIEGLLGYASAGEIIHHNYLTFI